MHINKANPVNSSKQNIFKFLSKNQMTVFIVWSCPFSSFLIWDKILLCIMTGVIEKLHKLAQNQKYFCIKICWTCGFHIKFNRIYKSFKKYIAQNALKRKVCLYSFKIYISLLVYIAALFHARYPIASPLKKINKHQF